MKSTFKRRLEQKRIQNRVEAFLDTILENGIELPMEGVKAVICEDGVILFDVQKGGTALYLIKHFETLPFELNLSLADMTEFNGGSGLRGSFYPDKKKQEEV